MLIPKFPILALASETEGCRESGHLWWSIPIPDEHSGVRPDEPVNSGSGSNHSFKGDFSSILNAIHREWSGGPSQVEEL